MGEDDRTHDERDRLQQVHYGRRRARAHARGKRLAAPPARASSQAMEPRSGAGDRIRRDAGTRGASVYPICA